MAWLLTEYGKSRLGLPGVPWRDLTDDEMAEAEKLHPAIKERGYFERGSLEDIAERAAEPDDDAAATEEVVGGRPRRTKDKE